MEEKIDVKRHRFPFCIVWTPIPFISWLFPFIGHMGIARSDGVIRDFAGSYYVSEDAMGFGWPTLYWQLSPAKVEGGTRVWDEGIARASNEYQSHIHNIICDNCHSMVALALNEMRYGGRSNWGMIRLCALILANGRFVGFRGFLRQYLPSLVISIGLLLLLAKSFLF